MLKNIKKDIVLLIGILIILIIICIIAIFLLNLKDNNVNVDNDIISEHGNDSIERAAHILENTNTFYTVENCINKYLSNETQYKDKEAISKKIWESDIDENISAYYVQSLIRDNLSIDISNEEEEYFVVLLDKRNYTYVIKENGNKYSEDVLNEISNFDISEIEERDNNIYDDITITNEDIVKKYYLEFIKNALYKPQNAYDMLEDKYRESKFGSFEKFSEYIDLNREKLIDASLMKYAVDQNDNYTQYTVFNNYNNIYLIKEYSVMNFKVSLDSYTVESEESNTKYNQANDTTKLATNLDKLFKMINNKEYQQIYEKYLNNQFRENNFKNYNDFENYMKEKFYDYNYLGTISQDKEGNYYVVSVDYKDGLSSAAEENSVTLIILLKDDEQFEFSFEI